MEFLNKLVTACYEICDDEWSFRFNSDQWWVLKARCSHREFEKVSAGGSPDVALNKLLEEVLVFHAKLPSSSGE